MEQKYKEITVNEIIYNKVMRYESLVNPGELILVAKEIDKFGWDLVKEIVKKGELDVSQYTKDNILDLYLLNLLKYINVRCVYDAQQKKFFLIDKLS